MLKIALYDNMGSRLPEGEIPKYFMRWIFDVSQGKLYVWPIHMNDFEKETHDTVIEELGLYLREPADYAVGYILGDGRINMYTRPEKLDQQENHVIDKEGAAEAKEMLQKWINTNFKNEMQKLLNGGYHSKVSAQYNVVEDYSSSPEENHDAWIFDTNTKTLYFLHGGHHAEMYESWFDPEDEESGMWLGDIENGTIRFWDTMRKIQPWETDEFRNVIEMVKNLSNDYSANDIDLDYHNHARYVKQTFNYTEQFRWLYDPINGLTVWPFISGYGSENHHSNMLKKLLGPDYYEYDNYTGGYIDEPSLAYPMGSIRQTYKAYIDPKVNDQGMAAVKAWLSGHQQAQLPPQYIPKGLPYDEDPRFSKTAYLDQLEERMRWIYAPHNGGLKVWPFYEKNHGDVLDEIGIYEYLPIDPDSPLQRDTDWCGGYIERDGKVWETYTAPSEQTNSAGLWLARAWVTQQLEPPIQGLAKKKKFKQRERTILPGADYKWAYTPGGDLHVWPVDPDGMPDHFRARGPAAYSQEAQGQIFDLANQYAIYTHPTRPQMQPGEAFSAWQERQQALQFAGGQAVEEHLRTNMPHDPDKVISKRQRPLKAKKREHIRKRDIYMFLGLPYGGGAVYPEGGQVDTTMTA